MHAGLFLLFATPLLFYPWSQDAFRLPKLLFAAFFVSFLLLFLALRVARGAAPGLRFSPAHLPFFFMFAVSALTFPWFADLHPDIRVPYLWGVAFGSFLLVASLDKPHQVRSAFFFLLLVGTVIALYGLLQYGGVDLPIYRGKGVVLVHTFPLGRGGTPFSTMGNPSLLGEYLTGVLPLALAGLLGFRRSRTRILLTASTLLLLFVLVLTQARAAWVGLAVGVGFLLATLHHLGRSRRKAVLVALLFVVALLAILATGMIPGASVGWGKVRDTLSFKEGSVGARLFWWRVTGEMIKAHPFLGVGAGRFREVYPAYQRVFFEDPRNLRFAKFTQADAPLEAPHNQYLHLLAEMGLFGLAFFLWLVGSLFWMGLSSLGKAEEKERPVLLGCLAGLAALLADGLFSYPLEIPSSLLLFSVLAGLIVAVAHLTLPLQSPPTPLYKRGGRGDFPQGGGLGGGELLEMGVGGRGLGGRGLMRRRLLVLLLGGLALFSFLHVTSLIKVYASSLHLHRGTERLLRGDLSGAAAAFERALEVNPRDPEIHGALASAYAALGRKEEAIELAEGGKRGFSSPGLYRFLGGLRYDLGEYQAAEGEYREGISTFPGSAPLFAAYGALLARTGRYPEALSSLSKAKALDPSYPDTYHYLGHLYSLTKRPREALLALREFLRLADPRDPRLGQDRTLMDRLR